MTIESLGRKGGPNPGEHALAAGRHGRRPQPETRPVPTARPKPAPPRPGPVNETRRDTARGPAASEDGTGTAGSEAGTRAQAQTQTRNGGRDRGPGRSQGPGQGQTPGPGQGPGPMQRRGRGDGKAEGQARGGDRSLYDGGSPSANRLGPAKAMRARDVSRPRD